MLDNIHKTHVTRWLILISLFSFSFASISLPVYFTDASGTTEVSVLPPSIAAYVNQDFSIDIAVSDVISLYGWEFKLSWSPTLLSVVSVVEGAFLRTGGTTFFFHNENQTSGNMIADCTLLGLVPGVSGNGVLATIFFHVEAVGECPLDMYDAILLGPLEQEIICEVFDGYGIFSVSDHDVAVMSVHASPVNVLPGEAVQVNVTVQNQGAYAESFSVAAYANSEIIGIQPVSLDSGTSETILFTWDTTGHSKGVYIAYANTTAVPGEVDTADNGKTADEEITLLCNGHDVAILSIEPSKTVVCETYCVYITIAVVDFGVYVESFDVSAFVNSTTLETKEVTLNSGASAILTFIWNTTGFSRNDYAISAYATPVAEEIDIGDNTKTDGTVTVAMKGDIVPDGTIDIFDITTVSIAFGSARGDPNWNPNADINSDETVDIFDMVIVALNFGETT